VTATAISVLQRGEVHDSVSHVAASDIMSPADRYGPLFTAVQSAAVFPDSKTFVDLVPRRAPEDIVAAHAALHANPDFDLARFVHDSFEPEPAPDDGYVSDPKQSIGAHIDALWTVLTRDPLGHQARSSLIALPHRYVVPGGRFSELYYWDSYFTMLGLAQGGRFGLIQDMVRNFAYIIDRYGHIPNGNRTYYLSRSQPPVFALMVALLERHNRHDAMHYLPQLKREYAYWMDNAPDLVPGQTWRTAVCMPDGAILNRYWDDRDTPREEAYREDVATAAAQTRRPANDLYRDLRAGAASGWDFSSRWLDRPDDLSSIRTTAILPIDLNAFLLVLEREIERLSRAAKHEADATVFHERACRRRAAIDRYLWDDTRGTFVDFDWQRQIARPVLSAAAAVPLYVGLASHRQAARVTDVLMNRLLLPGGLATTDQTTPQQWDKSNGWAPLQWMAIGGMRRYGHYRQAAELAHRWLSTVGEVYEHEAKLVEKYAITAGAGGGAGGEYPLQDGFGWTNGVTQRLLGDNPDHRAHGAKAGVRRHWR